MKKRYVLCGASGRGTNAYGIPITKQKEEAAAGYTVGFEDDSARKAALAEEAEKKQLPDECELVGIYDINIGRAGVVSAQLGGVPVFDDYDKMLDEAKPDCVIIATTDNVHADYVIRTLDRNVDVFVEKPMCINADQCRRILEAEKRNHRKIGVCFNMRYMRHIIQLKQIIDSGVLGTIYNVHFEWLLTKDYSAGHSGHGASYFHRWNGYMEKSGGLLLTKSTHHFDMINWLIGGRPKRVSAFGKLREYGANGEYRGERCLTCPHTEKCPYYTEITDYMQKMFVDNEQYDGYICDRCVFDKEVDIYDTMALNVEYSNGILMAYSESAAAMYEGFKLYINGSDARLECQEFSDGGRKADENLEYIRIIKAGDRNITTYEKAVGGKGSHAGSDDALRRVVLFNEPPELETQKAGAVDGAYSILIGAAANESIRTGKIIDIDELIGDASLLER